MAWMSRERREAKASKMAREGTASTWGRSGAKGDFLDEDVSCCRGEDGERDGRCRGVIAEGNRFVAFGADSSGGDNSRIKLNHGEGGE